ncbi:MAG: ATP-binding protein [Planctomycetes bacterium]|nr:ATP-binding protein [Planctomycetota bacterium]
MGGLPATGKSTVARKIATAMGAALLRSDVVRKSLLGIPLTRRWTGGMHEGPYAPDVTRRTYAHMREEAEGHLRAGRSVVVDATLPEEAGRDAFARLARECGCPSRFLLMEAPEATIRERMQARQAEADEVSDAGFEVWRQARREYEMPRSALRADGCSAPWHAVSLLLDSLATGRSAVC